MENIYLDNAATTALAPEVIERITEINQAVFGNPSSVHSIGGEARKIVDESRRTVAEFIGCKPEEIVFTSGGSESDNLAVRGVVATQAKKLKSLPHVITSMVEHHAILHTVEEMEKDGLIQASYIKPDADGIVSPAKVKEAIRDNTVLISVMYVNNETGVISPIREIGQMLKSLNSERENQDKRKIYFHTDAVQAAEFFDLSPDTLGLDLITFTAHKLHGPKGIGALYVRSRTPLASQISGGSHEFRHRAGTENVAGMAGLAKALEIIIAERGETKPDPSTGLIRSAEVERLIGLRDKIVETIQKSVTQVRFNGSMLHRAPHIVSFCFLNAEGEAIILNLDFLGIAVSSTSACTSQSLEPSHVLSAMDVPIEESHGTVRISLSRYTSEPEVDKFLEAVPPIIEKLRMMSPFKNSHENIKA